MWCKMYNRRFEQKPFGQMLYNLLVSFKLLSKQMECLSPTGNLIKTEVNLPTLFVRCVCTWVVFQASLIFAGKEDA